MNYALQTIQAQLLYEIPQIKSFYKASQSSRSQEELSRIQAREQVKNWKRKLEEQTVTATVACKESLHKENDGHE